MQQTGTVTRNDGPRFWVQVAGAEVPCRLRGRLKKEYQRVSSLLVVGDTVTVTLLPDGTGTIEEVAPRRTELVRPGFRGLPHVMAANVDQLVIVQAAREPRFKGHLVERFLATARRSGMAPLLVVNKADLESEATLREWVAPLVAAGLPVVLTSTVTGRGVGELAARLQGRISVLAGQSGVGKSSLVNALCPEMAVSTQGVSRQSGKGRHTTTSSRLYPLPGGGYLADTPGIRSLGLFDEDDEAVEEAFPEIVAAAAGCKFRDCGHDSEPGCAVKAAVERGEIPADRLRSYLRLMRRQ